MCPLGYSHSIIYRNLKEGSFYEFMIQNHCKSNFQSGCTCAQCHLKDVFGNWDIDHNECLSILKDGMESSVICLLHLKLIETINQFVHLIYPSCGNKIIKIQEYLSWLDVTTKRDLGAWIF